MALRVPRFAISGWKLDAVLLAAVLVAGVAFFEPGVFSVDESHYLLGCQAVAERGSYRVENGYEQLGDPALLFFYTVVPDRIDQIGTVASVPPFHALIAAPFYWLGGLSGLVLANLLAFGLCLVATRRIAELLVPSGRFALVACTVFGLASFSAEYAFGIWPHAISQALLAWAVLLLLRAGESRRQPAWTLAAGLLAGVACGVRLQNVVMLPVFWLAAWIWLKQRKSAWVTLLLGWAVPVAVMAWINHHRFGTFQPFTYGAHASFVRTFGQLWLLIGDQPWLPVAALAWLGLCVWLYHRTRWAGVWIGGSLAVLAAAGLHPAGRALLGRWMSHAGYHLVDTSLMANAHLSVGSRLNDLGQVLYGGVLKKGLLEAMPFVSLALSGLWPPRRAGGQRADRLGALTAIGLGGLLLLPFVVSTGGLCFNPRYLLELLPVLCVVALFWARQLCAGRWVWLAGALLGLLVSLPQLVHPGRVGAPAGGFWPMLLPLGVSALLLTLVTVHRLGPLQHNRHLAASAALVMAAAVVFSAAGHLGVDLRRSLHVRGLAAEMLAEARQVVPDRSILLAWEARKDVFSPLKLERDVWIARLDRTQRDPPRAFLHPPADRRVVVVRNGISAQRWSAWTDGIRLRAQNRKGLVFVELLRAGPP